jgi:SAM-dependent methyltransferase
VDVLLAAAERLPFGDGAFDVTLAQLVVHFMAGPVAGLAEMGRVTRPGGVVAACVWDHAGGGGPLTPFWRAVRELDPAAAGESGLPGARAGQLVALCQQAGLGSAGPATISVTVTHATFEDWWQPFTLGVGPAGGYVTSLAANRRELLRGRCRELLGPGPFRIRAAAWAVTCRIG